MTVYKIDKMCSRINKKAAIFMLTVKNIYSRKLACKVSLKNANVS